MTLLLTGKVERVVLNDLDPCVYSFWHSILNETERFVKLVMECPLTVEEWKRRRLIYDRQNVKHRFELGFSTFYLNRCNRSGILPKAGPIGGRNQTGTYKIDARFQRESLVSRILDIASFKKEIEFHNLDAITFLRKISHRDNSGFLVYLDPPYYKQGKELYLNYYKHNDHKALSKYICRQKKLKWIMSYDNANEISDLYSTCVQKPLPVPYSAQRVRNEQELLIAPHSLKLPDGVFG